MVAKITTLTERGQVSMPSALRKQLGLRPGQSLVWRRVSDCELRVTIPSKGAAASMRGFMKKFIRNGPANSAGWMKILREGEAS